MADIIDLKTNEVTKSSTNETSEAHQLIEILKDFYEIDGFLICLKTPDGDITLFRNNELTLKDRSYILQLIQSDIHDELAPTVDSNEEDE